MNPKLKKALKYLIALLIILGGVEIGVSYFHEDRVKAIAIEQLNTFLDTKVAVESIEFSLLRHFPKASIEFKNIEIFDNSDKENSPLKAQSIFLQFNPFHLLTGKYIVDEIQLDHAIINFHQYNKGLDNFHFFRKDSSAEHFQISLEKVKLNASSLLYRNHSSGELVEIELHDLLLSGKFTKEIFDLSIDMSGSLNKMNVKKFRLRRQYPVSLGFVLHVDKQKQSVEIKQAKTRLGKILVAWNGSAVQSDNSNNITLSFNSQDAKLSDIGDILPHRIIKKFDEFKANGHVDIDGEIKGSLGNGHVPSVELLFSLKNGVMQHRKSNIELNDINFRGSYTNGANQSMESSILTIDTISLRGNYGLSKGYFKINNFIDPYMSFGVSSILDLDRLKGLIDNDSIELLQGKCELHLTSGFKIDSLNSISSENLKKANTSGSIVFDSVAFKYHTMPFPIEHIKGSLTFHSFNAVLDSLHFDVNGIPVILYGRLHNLFPYLFYNEEKLKVTATLTSDNMNLNTLFSDNKEEDSGEIAFFPLSDRVSLALDFNIKNFAFRKFRAKSADGQLKFKHPILLLQNLNVESMEGNFQGWIQLAKENETSEIELYSELTLKHVNIHELFLQFENFGQSSFTQDYLKGYADLTLEFRSIIDLNSGLVAEKTYVRSRIDIINGELINYKPIMALSDYVDIEELRHIKFSKLSNEIEIKNRMVYIPEMHVLSSAIELKLSGKHSFDNEFDYHFELFLNDILFKKAKRSKKNQEEFGEIKADESGKTKIHVRMQGNFDDYKIKLDRKATRESWNENFQEERKELKQIFKEEFSEQKKEENVAPMNFEIEWDDGSPADDTSTEKSSSKQEKGKQLESQDKKDKKKAWLDKIGGGNEDEYETYDEKKFD